MELGNSKPFILPKLGQGVFSFSPKLENDCLSGIFANMMDANLGISIEYTTDPHPRNYYWEMWGVPQFRVDGLGTINQNLSPAFVLTEISHCIHMHPTAYVKVNSF